MSPQVPGRIGRYQVVGLIGTGAFATVFRARDDRLDADVAVKVLAENHSFDPDLRERFIMEGHLLRRVDSPHVVKVFDLGETDSGQPFLVLDLALGGDLSARRRALDPGRVEITDVMAAATQIAAALSALHAERVVHRDVTPGNLLIRSPGHAPPAGRLLGPGERLMLADLGLSKDLALASGLTVGAGTAGFAPPEQRDAAWIDPRADIWSASALVVWLATGHRPEDGGDWPTQLRRQGWPQAAAAELVRGLSDHVDARHPDAESWRAALHAALAPPSPVPVGRPDPDPTAPGPRRARRGLVGAAVIVVLLVVLAGGWWAGRATQGDGREQRTESVEGGGVRVSAVDGDLRVAAVGPGSVAVGSPARFSADVEGASQFVWIAPDGRTYTDAPTIELRPQSAGEARVLLTGVAADGKVVTVEHRLVVTEP